MLTSSSNTADKGHNPYFSGNSFAILSGILHEPVEMGHNPYFSGNSFAI